MRLALRADQLMNSILIAVLDGTIYGLIMFMLAAGLTITYGMMGIMNMAHSAFFMLGAYVAYTFSATGFFWCGLIVSPVLVGVLGWFVERHLLRTIHRHGHAQELIFTFGLAYLIEEVIKAVYGDFPVGYQIPDYLKFPAFHLLGADFPFYKIFMAGVSLAVFSVVLALLHLTRIGLVVRAAERLPVMTAALGHNVADVFSIVFAFGAWLAGLAGAVAGAYYSTSPAMATNYGIVVFVIVVVGGLGSIQGSFLASILIGVLTSLTIISDLKLGDFVEWTGLKWGALSGLAETPVSGFGGVIPFLLLIVISLLRPSGLMGERR
jgi:branched-chain amino acid transport system permease protein